MTSFLPFFFSIARLQKGPEDLPCSYALFAKASLTQLFTGVVLYLLTAPFIQAVYQVFIAYAISLSVFSAVLFITKRGSRILQVLTAVQGTLAVINLAAWPILWGFSLLPDAKIALLLFTLTLIAWSISIHSHILQRALEWQKHASLALAIALFVIRFSLFQSIVG